MVFLKAKYKEFFSLGRLHGQIDWILLQIPGELNEARFRAPRSKLLIFWVSFKLVSFSVSMCFPSEKRGVKISEYLIFKIFIK